MTKATQSAVEEPLQPGAQHRVPYRQVEPHHGIGALALRLGIAIEHSSSVTESTADAMALAQVIAAAADDARQAQSTVAIESFNADHEPASLNGALEVLRRLLRLAHHPDDARLLVVISASDFTNAERVERSVADLAESGVRILWVSTGGDVPDTLPDGVATVCGSTTELILTVPTFISEFIATVSAGS